MHGQATLYHRATAIKADRIFEKKQLVLFLPLCVHGAAVIVETGMIYSTVVVILI